MKQRSNIMNIGIALPRNAEVVILNNIRKLIEFTRARVGQAVNSELMMLYWKVGQCIHLEVLKEKRVNYEQEIVMVLSAKLVPDYGRGFSENNLQRMIKFAAIFTNKEIVASLIQRLTWRHYITLIPLKKPVITVYK